MMRALLLCLVAMLFAMPAHADELRLKTGGWITGVAASLAGGALTFKATGGALKIAWADVASLAIEQPMLVTVGTSAPTSAVFAAADANGRVTLVPGGPVALTEIIALGRPQPAWVISGGRGAGIVLTAGHTLGNNVLLSVEVIARGAADRYTVSAIATHANDRGVETARNWSFTGKYDRFLTSRLFANANANFTNDRFRDIDLRTALGAGIGYQVLETAPIDL